MTQITDDMVDCWRINYGLDKRSPEDAMRWWDSRWSGHAPAGAVAALGLLLQEREALIAEIDRIRSGIEREERIAPRSD